MFYGCDLIFQTEPTDLIGFTVTASTPPEGENTESLAISFSAPVTGLTANNITISEASGSEVQRGNLRGSGQAYTLDITVTGFGGPVTCSLAISKEGVSPSAYKVSGIVNNKGLANFSLNRVSDVADGQAKLGITFTKDVTLSAEQISITSANATRGELTSVSNSKKNYELTVTGASADTTVKIKIENSQVTGEERELKLEAATPNPPSQQDKKIDSISIILDKSQYYSNLLDDGTNSTTIGVETDFPRTFTTNVIPASLNPATVNWLSFDKSVATVKSASGTTTQVEGIWPGKQAVIAAQSPDGSVGKSLPLNVVGRIKPDTLEVTVMADFLTSASVIETSMGTKAASITLYRGDNSAKIETVLKGKNGSKTGLRTNDQDIFINGPASTKISIDKNGTRADYDPDLGDVPGWIYKLTPKEETNAVNVTIQPDYNDTLGVVLNISVEYKQISDAGWTVRNVYKKDKVTSATLGTGNTGNTPKIKFDASDKNDTIYLVFSSQFPIGTITIANNQGAADPAQNYVSWAGPLAESTGKERWYSVTRLAKFSDDGGLVDLIATATDVKDSTKTATIPIKIGGPSYNGF